MRLIVGIFLAALPMVASAVPLRWQRIIGFEKSAKTPTQDFNHALFAHPDGSAVVLAQSAVGETKSGGRSGYTLTWLDPKGKPLRTVWLGYHEGEVKTALPLPDGGFLLGGTLGGVDSGLARLNAQGAKMWQKAYEWREGTAGIGFMHLLPDGTFDVSFGDHRAHIDGLGNLLSETPTDGRYQVDNQSFLVDGSHFGVRRVGGDTPLPDNATFAQKQAEWDKIDLEVARFDPDGQVAWKKTFGGPKEESATVVVGTLDGGCVVAGQTRSGVKNTSYYLLRLDPNGNKVWEKAVPAPQGDAFLSGAIDLVDGGLAVVGSRSAGFAGSLLRLDAKGNKLWEKTYACGNLDQIATISDGGFLMLGRSGTCGANDNWFDLFVVKTDAAGNTGPTPKPIKL